MAFVVRADKPVDRVELGPGAPIQDSIEAWRRSFGMATSNARPEPGQEIRRLVWDQLEPHLEGATTILISPDGHGSVTLGSPAGQATRLVSRRGTCVRCRTDSSVVARIARRQYQSDQFPIAAYGRRHRFWRRSRTSGQHDVRPRACAATHRSIGSRYLAPRPRWPP